MRGYEGFSMSTRANRAYKEGKLPASKLAKKLGVSTDAIRAFLDPCEWHHTSARFNKTYFYDEPELIAVATGEGIDRIDADERREAEELLEQMRLWDRAHRQSGEKRYWAEVWWIEWSGSRKHPRAEEHHLERVEVVERGKFYYFAGIKKKIGSIGTRVDRLDADLPCGGQSGRVNLPGEPTEEAKPGDRQGGLK